MVAIVWNGFNFLNGLFALLVVIISLIIGILIYRKYNIHKKKSLLYWSIAWIGIYCAWLGSAVSFVYAIFSGQTIPDELYFFLASFFIPLVIVTWTLGLTEMILKDKRKILIIIISVHTILWDISLIIAITTGQTAAVGEVVDFDGSYELIGMAYMMSINLYMVVTGFIFALDVRKSKEKEPRIKALFLAAAFITYFLGGLLDARGTSSGIILVLIRLFLMSGSLLFYIGLFMPKPVKKLFKIE